MLRHGHAHHYKQYVTNWATLLTKSGPSCQTEVESSERHEVFTRTFLRHKNVFPIIPTDVNVTIRVVSPEWCHQGGVIRVVSTGWCHQGTRGNFNSVGSEVLLVNGPGFLVL